MKTFYQLTVGNKFYRVYKNSMELTEMEVSSVDSVEIKFNYGSKIPRLKGEAIESKERSQYRYNETNTIFYFTKKLEAIRYAKAQMMKTLFDKIKTAQGYIDEVKKFRNDNYELLNHEWTEETICKLERELNR